MEGFLGAIKVRMKMFRGGLVLVKEVKNVSRINFEIVLRERWGRF